MPYASTIDVYDLFSAYAGLYSFTEDDKTGPLGSKDDVEKIAQKLLVYITKDIKEGTDEQKGNAYFYLSSICIFREDIPKGLECLKKAVEFDPRHLTDLAYYKNYKLDDREGALADYNKALQVLKDLSDIERIKSSIADIDSLRNIISLWKIVTVLPTI